MNEISGAVTQAARGVRRAVRRQERREDVAFGLALGAALHAQPDTAPTKPDAPGTRVPGGTAGAHGAGNPAAGSSPAGSATQANNGGEGRAPAETRLTGAQAVLEVLGGSGTAPPAEDAAGAASGVRSREPEPGALVPRGVAVESSADAAGDAGAMQEGHGSGPAAGSAGVEAARGAASRGEADAEGHERGERGAASRAPAAASADAASGVELARFGVPGTVEQNTWAALEAGVSSGGVDGVRGAAPSVPAAAPRPASQVTLSFQGADGTAGTLHVRLRGPTLHATLVASDPATAERMSQDLGDLRRALVEQGFVEPRVSVQTTARADPATPPSERSGEGRTPPDEQDGGGRRSHERDFDSPYGTPRRRAPRSGAER